MNRYEFEDLISDYLDNKLTLSKRKELEIYLKKNPKSKLKIDQIKQNILFLRSLPKTQVSKQFDRKLRSRIKIESKKPTKNRSFANGTIFGFKLGNFSLFMFLILFSIFLSSQLINELFLPKNSSKRILTDNNEKGISASKNSNKAKTLKDSLDTDRENSKDFSRNIKLVND